MLQGIREWSLFCFGEMEECSVCPMVRPGKQYGIPSVFVEDGGYPPITEDVAQQLCNSNLPVIPDNASSIRNTIATSATIGFSVAGWW